jgi:hypothetical protein
MVFAALSAGAIGGFLVPDRPQSRPAEIASKAAGVPQVIPALRTSDQKSTPEAKAPAQSVPAAKQVEAGSCATSSWPYRAPGCLDRSASLESAPVLVTAKRVDPAISLRDVNPEKPSTVAENTPAPQQKVVSAPAKQRDDNADRRRPNTKNADSEDTGEVETAPANNKKYNRRPARRPNFRVVDGEWREEPRVYFRGRDGRLYLAPEYRRAPPSVYYIR